MAVTCGVVVLTMSLSYLADRPPVAGSSETAAEILEGLLMNERWTDRPGRLRASALDRVEVDAGELAVRGCRVQLDVVGGPSLELFTHGSFEAGGEREVASRAVSVCYGPQEVAAAMLSVWVWK